MIDKAKLEKKVKHLGACQEELLEAIEARKGPEIGKRWAELVAQTAASVAALDYAVLHFDNELLYDTLGFARQCVFYVGSVELSALLQIDCKNGNHPITQEFIKDVEAIVKQSIGTIEGEDDGQ